jgi:hypothetical protein
MISKIVSILTTYFSMATKMKKKYLRIRSNDLQRGQLYDLLTYPISMDHNCSIEKEKEKFGANVTLIDGGKKIEFPG